MKEKVRWYKQSQMRQNIVFLWSTIKKRQPLLIFISLLEVLISTCDVFMFPMLTKRVIEWIEVPEEINLFLNFILVYTGVLLFAYCLRGICENQIKWRIQDCRNFFMRMILKRSLTMEYEKLENPQVLDSYYKAMLAVKSENKGIEGMINSTISVLKLLAKTIVSSYIICQVNPVIVLIIFLLVCIQFVPTDRTQKRDKEEVWDKLIPYWRKFFRLNRLTQDFEYGKDIRLFGMSKWIFAKHLRINNEMQTKILHSRDLWIKCQVVLKIFNFIEDSILYSWLIFLLWRGRLTIAEFTLYVAVVHAFADTIGELLWECSNLRRLSLEVDDYRMFIEGKDIPKIKECVTGELPKIKIEKENCKYEFRFENVSFKYKDQEKYALRNINITIKAGQKLALVGLNGAGKTTFIKLLCRLYEPTEGRILLNGIDIKRIDKKEYYKLFAVVFQNVEIYGFSIAENVSMTYPEQTDQVLVEECICCAGLKDKIETLEKGIDTQLLKVIYSDGIELSGGEKQKLALARALYKDAPVIVLDEPTAALDPIAEHKQYQEFDKLIGKKTAIYISHRLASTRFCDAIAMFINGKIIEYGKHEDLLLQNGPYSEMYRIQSQYYMEEE